MLDRLISFLVALSLAFLVWLYMRSRDQETFDNVELPVAIQLAASQKDAYELEVNGPSKVAMSFSGPQSRIRELRNLVQRDELHINRTLAVPIERLDESRYFDTVIIEAGDVHPPSGVTCQVHEGRNRIAVSVNRLVEQRLPVRFQAAGGATISQWTAEPAAVLVRGPQEILEKMTDIPSVLFALPSRAAPLARPESLNLPFVPLVQELKGKPIRVAPAGVAVRLTVQPQQKIYELNDVPVQFLCPPNFVLRPIFSDERAGRISLRLQGPYGEELPAVTAYIDLSGRKWEPGLYEERVKLQLSKDIQLVGTGPRPVAFQLCPADAPIKTAGVVRSP
ncbi:MAG TPA: hypothetical protein VGP68_02800 [Gemmataceae bacterium]|jgi:hypothetical protein|nr:hypothetical protein [Gemmataceae bacterium]